MFSSQNDRSRRRKALPYAPTPQDVEVTATLELTPEQQASIDMHSFLNVVNVVIAELHYLSARVSRPDDVGDAMQTFVALSRALLDPDAVVPTLRTMKDTLRSFWDQLKPVLDDSPPAPEIAESVANLRSIFAVLDTRVAEMLERHRHPGRWVSHDIGRLKRNYADLLAAIQKNSKGRYQIVCNAAQCKAGDYLVELDIGSVDGDTITMPAVLQDVLRDLIANARKYTDPGGTIRAALFDDGRGLRLVVQDNGRGIPASELPRVVHYGYRASNVADVPTRGAGFGLTKAYWVARRFGGRMWIGSRPEVGTRVIVHIPRPGSPSTSAQRSQEAHKAWGLPGKVTCRPTLATV